MKKKEDFEFDLKSVKMHEPSNDFASRVSMEAIKQLRMENKTEYWMAWIPKLCVVGFILVLGTLCYLVISNFRMEFVNENFIFSFQVIGFIAAGLVGFSLVDRLIKRLILG